MRVLFSTGSPEGYMLPPQLGDEQITCGPDWPDANASDGRVVSRKTPAGEYDLGAIVASLPPEQRPDLVVCLVDASWRNLPRNLGALPCPRIALVADTHHLQSPLLGMFRYLSAESFDRIVLLYDRHHAALFHAAGFRNLFWFPGLTFPHGDAAVRAARRDPRRREAQIAFVGQTGRHHPHRARLLEALARKKVKLAARPLPQARALAHYGSSLVGFNASLNGDLNLRIFEILAAGAALLTDRLAPESGLATLLAEGSERVTYGTPDELLTRAEHLLARPAEARAVGAAGAAWFDRHFNEAARRAMFRRLAVDGVAPAMFDFPPAETTRVLFGGNTDHLVQTTAAYEQLQELHRTREVVDVAIDPAVPEDLAQLCATLPRIRLTRPTSDTAAARADWLVVGHDGLPAADRLNADRVFCWNADDDTLPALQAKLAAAGLAQPQPTVPIFHRSSTPVTATPADPATIVDAGSKGSRTVLFYSDEPNPHGVANYNHSILLGLVRAGWRVISAHPKFESPMLDEQRAAGVKHIWTTWNWGKRFARSIVDTAEPEKIIAAVRPDLVFFSDCWPISTIAAKHVAMTRGLPYLTICHSGDASLVNAFPNCLGVVAKQLAHAREVIAVAQSSLSVLRESYGLAADKGVVIHNGRPEGYFTPVPAATRARLRAELGVPTTGVLVLTAARFDVAKGYQFQLEALKHLGPELQKLNLFFAWAGTGELQPKFEAAVAQMQLQDRVRFLGHRSDIADLMGAADIFVLSTMKEAMPLSVMEAMARGLPVAASAVGGIPEELGETGRLLPDPNVDPRGTAAELVRTLRAWASDATLRQQTGEASRQRALTNFREEAMVAKTLALCDAAARSPQARPPAAPQVVVKLQGGLGNQMFQYAAGLALARRTGAALKLDLSFLRDRTPRANFTYRDYCLDLFQLADDCEPLPDGSALARKLRARRERHYHYDAAFESWDAGLYLDGYWQAPRYFDAVRDEVVRTFTQYRADFTPEQAALAAKIAGGTSVCLNVRRGDYVANPVANAFHGVCDENYFRRAVALMRERVPGAHFFVFSDDIEWCRTANLTDGAPTTLCSHDYAGDRFGAYLRLMSSCRHFIIPNSSFGWWAAYLSSASDKVVIVPDPWFDDPTNNTKDLLPASWIRLPKKGAALPPASIPGPAVSVMILCHDYARYLEEAVASVLQQTFQDFEIVLLDDGSTDESPAVAQRIAAAHEGRVRGFRLEDVGPSAARRFGAAQARGRYLLPLDADDQLTPEFLARTVPVLESNPKLGYVYTQIESFGERAPEWRLKPYDFALLCRQNNAPSCSLIRKAAFDEVGGYDAENWGYYEDWDLWLRLGGQGWAGQLVDAPLFRYRRHFSSSLSRFGTRLDAVYKAFVITRHARHHTVDTLEKAGRILAEMPAGWHRRPPLRRVEDIQALLADHPGNRHLLYLLALALARTERRTDAVQALRDLLARHPRDAQAAAFLAELNSLPTAVSNPPASAMPTSSPASARTYDHPLSLQRVKTKDDVLNVEFLRELAERFHLTTFVETGTFLGNSTAAASTIFPVVHTIELAPRLAAKARARFANEPRVHVHEGDSAKVLAAILPQITGPALYWLDGHFSEGITARAETNTPILEEIALIARSGRKDAVILVDDLRLFERRQLAVGEGSSLHGYPSVNELHEAVRAIDPGYQFYVVGDVALAIPGTMPCQVSSVILALTLSRLFDGTNLTIEEVMQAETAVGQAAGEERDALRALLKVGATTEAHGLGLHYRLWHAITLVGENKAAEACREYLTLVELGFPHWRITWYLAVALHLAGDNTNARDLLTELVKELPDFAPARALLDQLPAAAKPAPKRAPRSARTAAAHSGPRPALSPATDTLAQLAALNLHRPGQPLRLHLGCGEKHFDGYVNIDYPPSEHTCQTRIGADVFGDITKLQLPAGSVDEIRLHHVFEHFQRSEALAMLIRWHEALKPGGRLHLETPDIDGCARQLASNIPFRMKQAVIRHAFGSQEAAWAIHYDGWSEQKYHHVLSQMGFAVETTATSWPQPPHLANVHAVGIKQRALSRAELLEVADRILSEYIVADVPSERGMCDVWRKAMRDYLAARESSASVATAPQAATAQIPILAGADARHQGFDNDNSASNGEHLVVRSLIRPGDTVLDVGANRGDWSRQVLAHAPGARVHAFEPSLDTFETLRATLAGTPAVCHRIALADRSGARDFFLFPDQPELSGMNSCYRRPGIEEQLNQKTMVMTVPTQTLDGFLAEQNLARVDFLKIDVEGSELDVLKGAADALAVGRIRIVQFEYGGTYQDAGISLRQAYEWLAQFEFRIFRIAARGLVPVPTWEDSLENYRYANYLAFAPGSTSVSG